MSTRPIRSALLATVALALTLAPVTLADQVKRSGFWIPDVIISDIQESKLLYTNNLGVAFEPGLAEVEGIALDNNADMRAGHEALEAENLQQAATHFEAARAKAPEKWAKMWADGQLVVVYDKLNDPKKAVAKYLDLARGEADPHFLSTPPLTSLSAADDATKADLKTKIEAAMANARDAAATEALKQMLALTGGGTAQQQAAAEQAVVAATTKPGDDLPEQSAIAMPIAVREQLADPVIGPIVRDLWTGKFEDALSKAQEELSRPTRRLSTALYLQGVAQLGIADASGDPARYKDAALSFMRVAIHFPRSPWVTASRLETAYVHLKIDRPTIARTQIDQVRNLIDAEEDPAYAARLDQVVAALAAVE